MMERAETKPWIAAVVLELRPPTLKDNTADVDRLLKGIKRTLGAEHVYADLSVIKGIPHILRAQDYRIGAVLYGEGGAWHLIDLYPAQGVKEIYGLAADLGTSTVVVRLLDLSTRKTKDEVSFRNPQLEIGTDILTRIHFADQGDGLGTLQRLLIQRLNKEIQRLIRNHDMDATTVVGMSVAGNTTMTHLFLGLDPYWICREPYIPVINRPGLMRASELGMGIHPMAPVLVFPSVGSYLGGDLIAGILASGMTTRTETAFLVDVGTNAEVVIGNKDWLMGCAGAAGPALEGGVASMGMMAGPGVIDRVTIDPVSGTFKVRTIGNEPAVGICGSGLIDLVAQLFLAGMIDVRGKYVPEQCGDRLRQVNQIQHLTVVPPQDSGTGRPLTLSQPEIDAVLRSKAAMYTILTTVVNTLDLPMGGIRRFYVAGTFGTYIDPRSAITIGMIPDLPLERYVPLGNTSLEGASMGLLSSQARDDIYQIRDRITYMELNVNQEFMNLFSAARFIPHTDRSLFPSVKENRR